MFAALPPRGLGNSSSAVESLAVARSCSLVLVRAHPRHRHARKAVLARLWWIRCCTWCASTLHSPTTTTTFEQNKKKQTGQHPAVAANEQAAAVVAAQQCHPSTYVRRDPTHPSDLPREDPNWCKPFLPHWCGLTVHAWCRLYSKAREFNVLVAVHTHCIRLQSYLLCSVVFLSNRRRWV